MKIVFLYYCVQGVYLLSCKVQNYLDWNPARLLNSTKYYTLLAFYKQFVDYTVHWLLFRTWKNKSRIEYTKRLVYYSQSINRKARATQIMTPSSLTSAVNYSSSCQDILNHNLGTTSAALKQGNSQPMQARLDYDWLTSSHKLLSNRFNR
jgi:hypothetical protein